MGLWYATLPLTADESVVFRSRGNLFRGRRQIGGRVFVTDRRFLFAPSRLGALFDGRPIAIDLDDLTALQLAKPGKAAIQARGAGAHRRYQVEISTAQAEEAVTVRDHESLMRAISEGRRH